jgi:hypothetical protein
MSYSNLFEPHLNKNGRLNSRRFSLLSKEKQNIFLQQAKEYFPWIESAAEVCYCYSADIKEKPICPICGKKRPFNKSYRKSCGNIKCKNLAASEVRKEFFLEKYGIENPAQLPTHPGFSKANETKNQKIKEGTYKPWCKGLTKDTDHRLAEAGIKSSQTRKEKFASGEIEIWNKGLTKEDHPGIQKVAEAVSYRKNNNPMTPAEQEVLYEKLIPAGKAREHLLAEYEKQRKTTLERYGVESYFLYKDENNKYTYEKGHEAILEKYGGWYPESLEWKEKEDEILEKMYQTNLKKYGYKHAMQHPEVIDKMWKTKIEKGSCRTSNIEESFYKELLKRFSHVKRQYKTKEYPFFCDFFVEDINTYIEINYYYTHGGFPFDESNIEHIQIFQKLQQNGSEEILKIWSGSDVLKQKTAQKNNLNYVMLYNDQEINDWLKNFPVLNY